MQLPNAFRMSVQSFVDVNPDFAGFIKNCDFDNTSDKDILIRISDYVLNPRWTKYVVDFFRSDVLNILSLAIDFDKLQEGKNQGIENVVTCISLGLLLELHPDAESFVVKYFAICPAPFSLESSCKQPKQKKTTDYRPTELEIVKASLTFLRCKPDYFKNKWEWSTFFETYAQHQSAEIQYLTALCMAIYLGFTEKDLKIYLNNILSKTEIIELQLQYNHLFAKIECKNVLEDAPESSTFTSKNIVNIGGILLPVFTTKAVENTDPDNLVLVESTKRNLHKLALGVATNKAINLLGPVGCGKTTLVEYLADKTGRKLGDSFVKIQLGDQTDSKMLLGTYRCTDIPGEFVWQPGVLTQAVLDGSWLLLEDIDSASVDIASVIGGLIENQYLTVPGFRDFIGIAPGFQLFMTQRLITTYTGHHKKFSNATALLEKHVLSVNIEPMSYNELEAIIGEQFNCLKTIAPRMVSVFKRFTDNQEKLPRNSRLVSTRDLFKWCSRSIVDYQVHCQDSALRILQHAIDVFCCSYTDQNERLLLAKDVCSNLGIISEKANYYCYNYQPTITDNEDGDSDVLTFRVGRGCIVKSAETSKVEDRFCFTRSSSCLLERITCCLELKEPVLLVGETGTGKTSTVQFVANRVGQKLIVINMNQQSDSADLLGGYKPVDMKIIIKPLKNEFELAFCSFFNPSANKKFLSNLNYCFNEQQYGMLVKLMKKSYEAALNRLKHVKDRCIKEDISESRKRKKEPEEELNITKIQSEKELKEEVQYNMWAAIGTKLTKLEAQLKHKTALAFAFIEGSLVKAIKEGHWVLLDEINLANAETLECLSGLLEGSKGSLSLLERGDKTPIKRHPNFMLFACMNPSTDVGKKDLPVGLRNRFTEFYVEELTDRNDLIKMVADYFQTLNLDTKSIENIVSFYLNVRKEAANSLSDGLGHKPHFSLRSLCRALRIAAKNPCGTFKRSLYEAFCLSFLTQLDSESYKKVEGMIVKYLINDQERKKVLKEAIPPPKSISSDKCVQFEGYWIEKGPLETHIMSDYILTASVKSNLKDLVRIVSIGKLPILLQGDTSVGKTSLITYLAKASGFKCVRINNHEHTDLQEYVGFYVAAQDGKLVFQEGLLVQAMRQGHWIILDELNLAPSDVLEALNRVLDDNRELFIPETQQVVKAHPNFMLFATQNPPGMYGGRKMLSRAFRNRFVELHFNEIPHAELEFILHKRCKMPESYAKKMVKVMQHLQLRRRGSAAFAGKQGFITLRDLFRWGERYRLAPTTSTLYDWDQHLADEGYLLLAGRVRKVEEREEIAMVLEKFMKRSVDPQNLFTLTEKTSAVTKEFLMKIMENKDKHAGIVWTFNMRQLAVLVWKALQFHEPVLLVGETGGGKTTICNIIAQNNGQNLITVNCHMHTESSDFIGALRPVRDHSDEDNETKLFEWVYGPLVHAMMDGNLFLADEISLADDSVLERLNSLLEPERTLLIAEKGSDNNELIQAHANFHFIGTMNPGGDFGKKELSPALRNRFTEIWCETCTDRQDLIDIIDHNVNEDLKLDESMHHSGIGPNLMNFVEWFKAQEIGKLFTVSIRDILTWVHFINTCGLNIGVPRAYIHGAYLTFLDSLGSGVTSTENMNVLQRFEENCVEFMKKQFKIEMVTDPVVVHQSAEKFGIQPFYVECGNDLVSSVDFSFDAPSSFKNAERVLRALQLKKALLLEGSPGVGKTSLVTALAKASRNQIFRINLSDQTDISDLFGADLPVEGGKAGQFAWRDGPLLQALKQGHWILLDELNLASQSVLEGLNACLDHRGEIYIPELGKTFHVKEGTRFFGCQNPLKQGGSRRGLPKSFLNRFTQVTLSSLLNQDLLHILEHQFPNLPKFILVKMVHFNAELNLEIQKQKFGHRGAPWEFNLRDMTRWCEAIVKHEDANQDGFKPENLVQLLFIDRMRTAEDKDEVRKIFERVFERDIGGEVPVCFVTNADVILGDVKLSRHADECNVSVIKQDETCLVLRNQLPILRSLAYCVNMNWMSILVGPASCGKSSVVKTLAKLAGKTLRTLAVTSAMDTTDILGGFEQSDYTRHLDELSKDVEWTLLHITRALYADDVAEGGCGGGAGDSGVEERNASLGLHCMRMLEKFIAVFRNATKSSTMAEETRNFCAKLAHLDALLDSLINISPALTDFLPRLHELQQRGIEISQHVAVEESLNAGGKFEWVDSVLIKCLKEGSWLLVDNVNLCSPAVLDRLNALLEPNGVLTIGERGVDNEGRMITIRPHPNFRLFLTMDPKNGDISRAMRNRGVEIFMLEKCMSEQANLFDVKSLIAKQGLLNEDLIQVLVDLHEGINDLLPGEASNVSHLMHASFLIAQQLERGASILNAFETSIADVYLNASSIYAFGTPEMSQLQVALFEKIRQRLLAPAINECRRCVPNQITLRTKALESNSQLAHVEQQATLLLENFRTPLGGDEHMDASQYCLIHFFSMATREDVELRLRYMRQYHAAMAAQCRHFEFIKDLRLDVDGPLPLELRWLPDTKYYDTDVSRLNRMFLQVYYNIYRDVFEPDGTGEVRTGPNNDKSSTRKQGFTLLQYLISIRRKEIDSSRLDNVLLKNVLQLCSVYDAFIGTLLGSENVQMTNEQTIAVLSLLEYRFLLYKSLKAVVKAIDEIPDSITNVHVHYKWFIKHSVRNLLTVLNINDRDHELQGLIDLHSLIDEINSQLPQNFNILKKVAKLYQNTLIRKPPLTNAVQLETIPKVHKTLDMLDICNPKLSAKDTLVILKAHRRAAILLKDRLTFDFEDTINCEHLQVANINIPELGEVGSEELRMLTILDYFTLLKMINMRSHTTINIENMCDNITVPVRLTSVLQMFKTTNDDRLWHEVIVEMHNYLRNSVALNLRLINNEKDLAERTLETCRISLHMPALSYLITECFLDEKGVGNLQFGTYRETLRMTQNVNTTLWMNMKALSDKKYDYASNEITNLLNGNRQFWKDFAISLKLEIKDGDSVRDLYDHCATTLRKLQDKSRNELSVMEHVLELLNENYEKLNQDGCTEEDERLNHIADGYILLSYAKLLLHAQLPMMDSLSKVALRKDACEKERHQFEALRSSYETQNAICSGNARGLHPLHPLAGQKLQELEAKLVELRKYVAVRPDEAVYRRLHMTLQNALTTIFAPSKFLASFTSLCASRDKLLRSRIDADVDLERLQLEQQLAVATLTSYDSFIEEIRSYRCVYPDYVEPLLAAGVQLVHGFQLRIGMFKKLCGVYEQRMAGFDTARVLRRVAKIPALSHQQKTRIDVANYYISDEVHQLFAKIFDENEVARRNITFDMLKCALAEMSSVCRVSVEYLHVFEKNLFDMYNHLVEKFVDAWKQQQIDVETKKNEAESLYKIKTKCDDKTDDEQAAIEFQALFPSYHESDFTDFISKDLGDDPAETEENVDEYAGVIKQDDIEYISQIHTEFMLTFTKTEWLNPKYTANVPLKKEEVLMKKLKLLKTIISKNVEYLSYTLDRDLIGSLSILMAVSHNLGHADSLVDETPKKYNFYRHANVGEVKNCFHIIKELECRIKELLDQWPGHPTLQSIMTIITRILSFDITSPLPRFLTGLDILLTKCHEWEENAHSGVSLSMHFLAITQQIITWRQFEMANWRSSLDIVYDRMVTTTYKYWFHLYDIMREYIYDQAFDVPELVSSLQKFILQSTIVEFPIRVRLLLAFHCHATYLKPCLTRDYFVSIMWNLYKYYEQFIPNVIQQTRTLRTPIEKKLKDYVKIVRWKDISYWALKETLDKTHKIIHKHMREFEAALRQPANQFMTNSNTSYENQSFKDDTENEESGKSAKSTQTGQKIASKQYYTINVGNYVSKLDVKPIEGLESVILINAANYYQKMKSLCSNVIHLCKYPRMICELDYFIAQVIITSKHLQSLEVDKTLVKEKQISQAKGHLQQKQRALSDLFKTLSKIGLSFRRGIVENKQDNIDSDYIIRPLDLTAMLGHLVKRENDAQLLEVWESVEIYNRKSAMRLEILENMLKSPAMELGIHNIERCKGFSLDLMQLAFKQKRKLVTNCNQLYAIRHIQMIVETLAHEKQCVSKSKIDDLSAILLNTVHTIKELMIIMSAAPEDDLNDIDTDIPVLTSSNCIASKKTSEWQLANSLLSLTMNRINEIFKILQCAMSKFFVPTITTPRVNVKYVAVDNITSLKSLLQEIVRNLKEFIVLFGDIEVVSHLHILIKDLEMINMDDNGVPSELKDINNYKRDIRKSIEATLFSVQHIAEKYVNKSTLSRESDKEADAEELQDNQLNNLIVDEMDREILCLNIPNVCRRINTILETVCGSDITDKKHYHDLLDLVAPFLDQIIKLYQFLIVQQVSAFRVTCKMASVLLNIFIDLATKGFCVPPELEAEMKEGESKVSSGMGLGEGEGEKDVSDKIESEDQLEDAQPAGQERKDEDKDCKEEEKGIEMSEDFDSKLQDVEKKPDDEDNDDDEDKDSDAEEQMGDTDKGADQLDKQIWGSDDEEPPADEQGEGKVEEKGDSGEKVGEEEMKAKDDQSSQGPEENNKDGKEEKDKKQKEINEMEEPEFDDEQTDPYHGKQPELPEPEDLELPEDLQLDDEREQEEQTEENPFDIDAMKEQMSDDVFDDQEKEEDKPNVDDNKQTGDESEDDEGADEKNDQNKEIEAEDPENQEKDEGTTENEMDNKNDEVPEKDNQESVYDQTQSQDNTAQAMDVDNATAADNVQINPTEQQKAQPTAEDTCHEDNPDKEGVGQSQMEKSKTGHKGEANAEQNSTKQQDMEEKKRNRPGETDADRCLGDNTEPVKKKMKTIDSKNNKPEDDQEHDNAEDIDAEIYKHIKEAKQSRVQVMDAVTQEQAEKLKEQQVPNAKEDEEVEDVTESEEALPNEDKMDDEMTEVDKTKAEKIENEKKQKLEQQKAQGDILDEINEMDVEGDVIETQTVSRSAESTYHTQLLANETRKCLSVEEINTLRSEVEHQLSSWKTVPNNVEAEQAWEKITSVTSSLAQELSEQLRLVLEPTQASRLKGDFRTGRRINMRKVIPYIASQFRKDKIWLRRTKPSKREYQIVLAIDDSSSMDDNHSKELAFESVALISKALTLLESGQLSILSFGETTQVLHKLTDTFTEKSGSNLLQQFKFEQQKTCVAKLVEFATEMLNSSHSNVTSLLAKLLIIVSDGRGIFSEGESYVQQAVRRARLENLFMIFVIIDNPKTNNSILDIRKPLFQGGKIVDIISYLDTFPFPFYIVLKDINTLPQVLSDALRQWFEMVSNVDRV